MPEAGGYSKTTIGRSAWGAVSQKGGRGLLGTVGVDTGDDGAARANLVERDREGPPALLAGERGDLGGVAVGDDPGDAAGVGEPAEVLPVGGLVDREVGRERQEVRGHDAREAKGLAHGQMISKEREDVDRSARPGRPWVACYRSGRAFIGARARGARGWPATGAGGRR